MATHRTSIWQLLWKMLCYTQWLYWLDTFLWLFIAGLPILPGLIICEFFNTLTDKSPYSFSSWGSPYFWRLESPGLLLSLPDASPRPNTASQ